MTARFVQIHTLTSYPAALLNRDDAGFAKRLPFGGKTRTRISSQCLKRHWRRAEADFSLRGLQTDGGAVPMSVRSRSSFERHVLQPLLDEGKLDRDKVEKVVEALMNKVLGESAAAKKAKSKEGAEDEKTSAVGLTNQVTILGEKELGFLRDEARAIAAGLDDVKNAAKAVDDRFKKEAGKTLQTMKLGAGLDAALFGRMVTSDILARCDAAVHVAHAFTVHSEESEPDYFSAMDDIQQERGEIGSGHINTSELTSGLYYSYVVVDVPLLLKNLGGDAELAAGVLERLVQLIAKISPGAKLGSTAPHAYAHCVLVETGRDQPRTLANAFLEPVFADGQLIGRTYERLAEHLEELDGAYGRTTVRRALALGKKEKLQQRVDQFGSLADLASFAAGAARAET